MSARLYFEDFPAGVSAEVGEHTFTSSEIAEFAERYDPQPFHIDAAAAAASPFQGIIASGWQTCSVMMGLVARKQLANSASMGSPGVDEIRWFKPMRAGDTLKMTVTVLAARVSASKPDRGILEIRWDGFNQHGEKTITVRSHLIMGCRPAA